MCKQDHPDKGKLQGRCNRRSCQAPNAEWFNIGTQAYYCGACAGAINGCNRDIYPEGLCHHYTKT